MKARLATEKDLPSMFSFLDGYTEESLGIYGVIDKERIKQFVTAIIKFEASYVMEEDDAIVGAMVGSISPCMFTCDTMFHSMFFYIVPSFRSKAKVFVDQIEELLKLKPEKITKMIIGNPAFNNFNKLDKFYRLLEFELLESHYFKEIN